MKEYPSRWRYYIYVIAGLIAFNIIVLLFFVPTNPDLYYNIYSEVWGITATIVLLMFIVEYRDYSEWKSVRKWVERRMGRQLYTLFKILSRFIYGKKFSPFLSKEQFLGILKDLNDMEEATLTEYAYHYYFPKPLDDMSIYQLDVLSRLGRYLSDLELRYSRFIKPEIRISLMEVQYHLDFIEESFKLVKRFPPSEEVVEENMPKSILRIMKEIFRLYEMGIEIYSETAYTTETR